MVAINTLLCVLGLSAFETLANPIAIQRRSPGIKLAVAFGDAPARRAPGQTSSSSSSAWHYEPTTSLSPSSSTTTAAPTASSTDTHSSSSAGGISLNGVSVPSFDSSRPFAVAYSPYTSSGGCKDVSAIESDLQAISASGFQCIRLYGTDCNQVSNVLSALESTGSDLKLFLGVFDLGSASSQASTLISALGGDWSKVVTVSVGNEPVNQGLASAATVVSTTSAVRSQLRTAGYTGPVVAVDTFIAIYNNPALCEASDYIAANAHAYFDGNVAASGAGAWVAQQASKLSSVCGGKDVLITESGWPSSGNSNGAAVASKSNQATAKSSILSAMNNKCVLFSAFDDSWKAPGSYGVEQYWGLL